MRLTTAVATPRRAILYFFGATGAKDKATFLQAIAVQTWGNWVGFTLAFGNRSSKYVKNIHIK
jgi:hypothetical protein